MIATRILLFIALLTGGDAFAPESRSFFVGRSSSVVVHAYNNKNNNNPFDISKPVFDLFSLRIIRGDALLRYNTLNQSEPLRINLYALLAVTLFSAPLISESVTGETINTVQTIVSTLGGILSAGLFVRECQRRANQLNRMEKELTAENLQIRISANVWSDRQFEKPQTLKELRQSSNPPRILALSGTVSELNIAVASLRVLGRRLQQSSTLVVLIPSDDNPLEGKAWKANWLAEPYKADEWKAYFNELAPVNEFRWFGLNFNGRSFGSGSGEFPQWLELLGQHLRPTEMLDETDNDVIDADSASILQVQKQFYAALTSGDFEAMKAICSSDFSEQVTQVVNAGGRIDTWKDCLMDGARPEGMQISGSDACILSDTEAYSTVIEFPQNTGVDTATLLAVQKWVRSAKTKDDWKLELHQTIPWRRESRAQGTLRCDCRGCVALTRSYAEQRTFGGLIG